MKRTIILVLGVILAAGCATQTKVQVLVTPMGEEPDGVKQQFTYALPRTVLKLEVIASEVKRVPGPYWEYAERFLGISEVIRQKSNHWQIRDVRVIPHEELDPQQFYSLNVLAGELPFDFLDPFKERGVLVDGTGMIHEVVDGKGLESEVNGEIHAYMDLGVESNFEERAETMYKTLVTDTSFVRVPVQRTVVEQKSLAMKAEEAADFLLEIRTRRFEMLTGEYEVYPNGEAMAAAIAKLDQLEAAYLSLFTGKTVTRNLKRAYFIVPGPGSPPSSYRLDMFSEQLGFVPPQLMEGIPFEVRIEPLGTTRGPGSYFSGIAAGDRYDKLIYRIPDVAELKVLLGEELLSLQRISIFQSGEILYSPIGE